MLTISQIYDRYVIAQEHADAVFKELGKSEASERAQDEANALYEAFEYASGLKSVDYFDEDYQPIF